MASIVLCTTKSSTKLVIRQLHGCQARCKSNSLHQRQQLSLMRSFSSGKNYGAWLRDSAFKLRSSLTNSEKEAGEKAATNLPAPKATSRLSSWRTSLSSKAKAQVEAGKDAVRQSAQTVQSKASQLAQRGQEKATQSVQQASSQLKTKASQLAKNSQEKASQSIHQASSQFRNKASQLAQTSHEKASQSIHQASSNLQTKASQLAQTSQVKASQSAQRASSQVKSATSNITSERFLGGFRSMGRDSLRWIWWWSLAAIAVYGMATTLPGQLLREYNHSRRLESNKRSPESTANETNQRSSDGSAGFSSGYFTTTPASSKSEQNDAEEPLPSLDTGYSRWTAWLPATSSGGKDLTKSNDNKTSKSRWLSWSSGGSER